MYNLKFEIELPTNYQSDTEIRALSSIPGQRIFDSALLVENYINVLYLYQETPIWLKIGMRRNQMFDETNESNCLEFESSLFLIDNWHHRLQVLSQGPIEISAYSLK